MSKIGLQRGLAGFGVGLSVGLGVQENTTNGRQGKSAAFGRAHVVGFVKYFWHSESWPCWRPVEKHQRFQRSQRRRPFLAPGDQP